MLSMTLEPKTLRAAWHANPTVRAIEARRKELLTDDRLLSELPGGTAAFDDQSIAKAARGSKNFENCLRLCQLAKAFGTPGVLELGTNLGISSAYLALGAAPYPVLTCEMSGARISIAQTVYETASISNVRNYHGTFDQELPRMLETLPRIGLAFIDGDHTYEGTRKYFARLLPHLAPGGVVVFDDVEWSDGMRRAWAEISGDIASLEALTTDGMGILRLP